MDFSGFMIDMDGTIYKGKNIISGAMEFIAYLQKKEIPFVFLTNNSSCTRSYYHDKLAGMGFRISANNILTSGIITSKYITEKYPGSKVFVMASPDVTEEMRSYGIDETDTDPDIVCLTFDKSIDYKKINDAYHFILGGAKLIATHPDMLCPTETSYDVDIGAFIEMFENLTGCKAEIIGKPNPEMLKTAASVMGVDPWRTVMVGDRLYTDIKMASDAGTNSILVLSGETSEKDLECSETKPTFVLKSVGEIPGMLNSGKV